MDRIVEAVNWACLRTVKRVLGCSPEGHMPKRPTPKTCPLERSDAHWARTRWPSIRPPGCRRSGRWHRWSGGAHGGQPRPFYRRGSCIPQRRGFRRGGANDSWGVGVRWWSTFKVVFEQREGKRLNEVFECCLCSKGCQTWLDEFLYEPISKQIVMVAAWIEFRLIHLVFQAVLACFEPSDSCQKLNDSCFARAIFSSGWFGRG